MMLIKSDLNLLQEIVSLSENIISFCDKIASDISSINMYAKYAKEMSVTEYHDLLVQICEFQKILQCINSDENSCKKYSSRYGVYYRGIDTNWDILNDAISTYSTLRSKFNQMPSSLRNKLLDCNLSSESICRYIAFFDNCNFSQIYLKLNTEFSFEVSDNTNYEDLKQAQMELQTDFSLFDKLYNNICSIRKQSCDYESIIAELELLGEIQSREKEMQSMKSVIISKNSKIVTLFKFLYLVLEHKINIPILYLSKYINAHKKEYYDLLNILQLH